MNAEDVAEWHDRSDAIKRAMNGVQKTSHAEQAAAIRALIAERDKFRKLAADALPFMAKSISHFSGAPDNRHIIARYYDMMVEAGCDMDDFVRWEP